VQNNNLKNIIFDKKRILFYIYFEWMLWAVISISIISLITLMMGVFIPKVALFLGLATSIFIYAIRIKYYQAHSFEIKIQWFLIIGLIFIALVFRADPYPWIYGGQDQGVYVNMSAYFQTEGTVFIEDKLLNNIPPGVLRDVYENNLDKTLYQLGVYFGGAKDYVFQFYLLHPLWMSLFADLFGDQGRFYSLTFFSLLSIVGIYLLVLVLSRSQVAAFFAGFILAVNPLHVFFSKWPVTEVIVLAFSLLGFFFLSQTLQIANKEKKVDGYLLSLSVLLFSLIFFVRITGFLYFPLLVFFLWVGIWLYRGDHLHTGLVLIKFSIVCLIFYSFSVIYGLMYSAPYAHHVYGLTFGRIFGQYWQIYIFIFIGLIVLFTIAWIIFSKKLYIYRHNLESILLKYGVILFFSVTFISALIGLYNTYRLGFTDSYISSGWYGETWGLAGLGFEVFYRSSVINWLLYSSPLLVFVALWAAFKIKWSWHKLTALIFLSIFLSTNFVINAWVLPYQYYYARYLLSEAVPFTIVLSILILFSIDNKLVKYIKYVALIITIIIFSYLSLIQFDAEEGRRPYQLLNQISEYVDSEDLLIFDKQGWSIYNGVIQTPLIFYYGINTFPISTDKELEIVIEKSPLITSGNVWLLTPKQNNHNYFSLERKLLHYDKVMERSGHVPLTIIEEYWYQELYLYKLKEMLCTPPNCLLVLATDRRMLTQVGRQEGPSIHSTGTPGFLLHGPYQEMNAGIYLLSIGGDVALNGGTAIIGVAIESGNTIIKEFLLEQDSKGLIFEEEIIIGDGLQILEIRIWVDDLVEMRVDTVELSPLEEQ
jgi:hypothetical protein